MLTLKTLHWCNWPLVKLCEIFFPTTLFVMNAHSCISYHLVLFGTLCYYLKMPSGHIGRAFTRLSVEFILLEKSHDFVATVRLLSDWKAGPIFNLFQPDSKSPNDVAIFFHQLTLSVGEFCLKCYCFCFTFTIGSFCSRFKDSFLVCLRKTWNIFKASLFVNSFSFV